MIKIFKPSKMKRNIKKPLRIELPEEIFTLFEEISQEHCCDRPEQNNDTNAGISRARYWFEKKDCAILSAWRNEDAMTKKINQERNKELCNALRRNKYGVTAVQGYYSENGTRFTKEASFFIVNFEKSSEEFFVDIRNLSETYNQDCFLFKKAGKDENAFLYGTNDDFGRGRREMLGEFQVKAVPAGRENSTRIGNKWMLFKTIPEE